VPYLQTQLHIIFILHLYYITELSKFLYSFYGELLQFRGISSLVRQVHIAEREVSTDRAKKLAAMVVRSLIQILIHGFLVKLHSLMKTVTMLTIVLFINLLVIIVRVYKFLTPNGVQRPSYGPLWLLSALKLLQIK